MVAQLPKQDVEKICQRILDLPKGPDWIVISGGNPATLKLEELVDELHELGFKVMVETQGTIFNDWLRKVDEICVSPKPPSSGNAVIHADLGRFMTKFSVMQYPRMYFKVVVFDNDDYHYAKDAHHAWPDFDFFISAGNTDPSLPTVGNPHPAPRSHYGVKPPRDIVAEKFRWLAEKVARDPDMKNVRVMPQLHVIAWGNERGR